MADELTFYTNPMSRARIVRWMLEEVGQPYRVEQLEYGTTMKSPEYLAINPMGKVPAIMHGDVVVTEAAAICAYLADAFPQAGLAPTSTSKLRAPYYRWMFYAAGPLEAAWTTNAFGFSTTPDQAGTAGWGTFQDVIKTLEWAVGDRRYLVGDSFTAADLYVGAQLGWGLRFGSFTSPIFKRYVAQLEERPAFKRATELDGPMPQSS